MKPNRELHRYVVGIDFGHGETSAGILFIEWGDELQAGSYAVKEISLWGNKIKVMKSAIAVIGNEIAVGDEAADRIINTQLFRVCFKKKPSLMNSEDRQIMLQYMQKIYQIVRCNTAELTDENHFVYIACPSNWEQNEKIEYIKIAQEANLPVSDIDVVTIIRESRAAFIYAQTVGGDLLGIRNAIEKGALVIDFGSSTVDFTFFKRGDKNPIDGSCTCGASFVENAILDYLIKQSPIAQKFVEIVPCGYDILSLKIREKKEDLFSRIGRDDKITNKFVQFDFNCYSNSNNNPLFKNDKYCELDITHKLVDSLLKEKGYYKSIRREFEKFRNDNLKNNTVHGILLTGGAVRMNFIQQIAQEVFGTENIYCDNDPSMTISNGITITGRADIRTIEFLNKLQEEAERILNKIDFSNKLLFEVISELHSSIMSGIDGCVARYRNRLFFNTDEFQYQIKDEIEYCLTSNRVKDIINAKFKKIVGNETELIIDQLNRISKEYGGEHNIVFDSDIVKVIDYDKTISIIFPMIDIGYLNDNILYLIYSFWGAIIAAIMLIVKGGKGNMLYTKYYDKRSEISDNIDGQLKNSLSINDWESQVNGAIRETIYAVIKSNIDKYRVMID